MPCAHCFSLTKNQASEAVSDVDGAERGWPNDIKTEIWCLLRLWNRGTSGCDEVNLLLAVLMRILSIRCPHVSSTLLTHPTSSV